MLYSVGNLALGYLAVREPRKAVPLLQEYLAGQKKLLGDSPQCAGIQASVASDLLKAGEAAAAEPILRDCLAIREKAEPDAWTTFDTRSMLGDSLLGQKKYAEAEPLLLSGYEGLQARAAKIPANSQVRLPEAIGRLVRLHEATGRADEAAQWLEKLWALAESPPAPPAAPKP